MKKLVCILTVMLFAICPLSFSNAMELDSINASIVSRGCIECFGGGAQLIDIDTNIEELKGEVTCSECKQEIKVNKLRSTYSSNSGLSTRGENFTGHGTNCTKPTGLLDEVVKKHYSAVTVEKGKELYIHNDLIDAGKRLLYAGNNQLVSFDTGKVDIYMEEKDGQTTRNTAEKVKIAALYVDGKEPLISGSTTSGLSPLVLYTGLDSVNGFLVCENHRKCKACEQNVASSGVTQGNSGTLYLSKYCKDHACAFVWEVDNSSGSGYSTKEGLVCRDMKLGDDYCKEHKCVKCDNPVIGVNTENAYVDPVIYQDSSPAGYSNYCGVHFCLYLGCIDTRITTDQTPVSFIEREVNSAKANYAEDFHLYCLAHCNKCGVCGKEAVTKNDFNSSSPKMICQNCQKTSVTTNTCASCSKSTNSLINFNGKDLCFSCYLSEIKIVAASGTSLDIDGIINNITASEVLGEDALTERINGLLGSRSPVDLEDKIRDTFANRNLCKHCGAILISGTEICPLCTPGRKIAKIDLVENIAHAGLYTNNEATKFLAKKELKLTENSVEFKIFGSEGYEYFDGLFENLVVGQKYKVTFNQTTSSDVGRELINDDATCIFGAGVFKTDYKEPYSARPASMFSWTKTSINDDREASFEFTAEGEEMFFGVNMSAIPNGVWTTVKISGLKIEAVN